MESNVILTKEHFADVNSRVQSGELTPGEAYKLLQRIQLDKDSYCPTTAEDKIEMVRLYTEQMLSCKQIGQRFKCHEETVRYHLNLLGVKLRGRNENARVKLTDDDVRDIRASTDSTSVLARKYGVRMTRISNIRGGKTRANVPEFVLPEGIEGSRQALNLLPVKNEAMQDELRKALKHAEQSGHLLKTVSNVS